MTNEATRSANRTGLLRKLSNGSETRTNELRRRHPERFHATPEGILTVDQIAVLLRCSVDQARRIPRTELPAYQGPGKYVLFFRDEVTSYLRNRRKNESMAHGAALKARRDRKEPTEPDNVHIFDPSATIARLTDQGD